MASSARTNISKLLISTQRRRFVLPRGPGSRSFSGAAAVAAEPRPEAAAAAEVLSGSILFDLVKEYEDYRRNLYGGLTHKALLVDAVGTLVVPSQPTAQIYRQIGEKYGVEYSETEILNRYRWAYEQPWGRSRLRYVNDGRPFWQYIVSSSTGCSDSQYFEELYNYYTTERAWHLCDPDAEKAFLALRESGIKVAVVSNFDTRLRPLLKALKCDHWFDAVAVSAEVEAEKPNPTIFLKACEFLGVQPEDAVHVGDDRRNDIWGARDAGCDAWLWGSAVKSFKEVAQRIGVEICVGKTRAGKSPKPFFNSLSLLALLLHTRTVAHTRTLAVAQRERERERERMERIHVSVRARPLSAEDAKSSPWRISGNSIFIPNQPTKFDFDRIFGEDCETQDVYNARTRDIVAAAVSGFNGTVFAYGQTSSGKTHTMRGSVSEPGVIPLAVHDLFDIIQQEMDREFLLRMSYMEIYNEEVNDLLAPEHRKLQIHESIERGIFVAGLREEIVASPHQILQLMEFGESHRHVGETNMNVHSSRSHTIFRMIIESKEKSDDALAEFSCDAVRVSVLNLVDLAGSERAAKTGAEGVRLKEGSHINKSLMTLGTVIKKLSEGAESQGGHVPYRDSKLTRILQSALGGNSNTAIICNITLAQIHADETKSSLQFASRALRVTNFAHINEILTDAALLKRQKKEIEELRAKLQGLQSEHLEEEILNLRNTLLQSELERERMALELEEEKRAHAERERRLQEQAKKIENLSFMVFCANREEACDVYKKAKRRDTWCPGNICRKKLKELSSTVKDKTSEVKSTRADRRMGSLLPFKELVNEANNNDENCEQDNDLSWSDLDDFTLPPPQTLLHVTSRRKVTPEKRSLPKESNDTFEMEKEYENLLLEFETHRIMSAIQIDCLMRKIAEADLIEKSQDCTSQNANSVFCSDVNTSSRDLDAILVMKKLQEKIGILETENSSSQQNLDCVFDLATEQTKSAKEKYEKLYEEFILAREEATTANDKLASAQSSMEEADWLTSLLTEAKEMKVEFEHSRHLIGSLSSAVDELLHFSSIIPGMMLDLSPSASQSLAQIESIVSCHEKIQSFLRNKVRGLEDEKLVLYNQASDLRNRIEELSLEFENSANAFMELNEEHEAEKSELIYEIQLLQKEMSSLSSCSLAKEKENIRKELEKTKMKLKDMEFKLKNSVQEKTKLEGEKSCAERELKRLQSQKAMIERDMSKRESIIARRHDSTIDRSLNLFDQKRAKGSAPLAELEEEYKKLEVLAFEMETKIASLEDELAAANGDKDDANSRAESLASDLQALSDELYLSNSELSKLKEEVSVLRTSLEESRIHAQKMESSLKSFSEEKEELSMQLTDALLSMEEDKAIWLSKERASIEAIGVKEKTYTAEIASLSKKLSDVTNELEICRKNCKDPEERTSSEQDAASEKQYRCFDEKPSEANLCTKVHASDDVQSKGSPDTLSPQRRQKTCEEIEILQLELSVLRKERQNLLAQVQELAGRQPVPIDDSLVLKLKHELEQMSDKVATMEDKTPNDKMNDSKEKAKLRMRLRGAQLKLDIFRDRYKESVVESEYMNQKFEEASAKLKKQLAEYGTQVLSLKKQLAVLKAQ